MTTTFEPNQPEQPEGNGGSPKEFVRMIPLSPIVETLTKNLKLYRIGELDEDQIIGLIFKLLTVPLNKK